MSTIYPARAQVNWNSGALYSQLYSDCQSSGKQKLMSSSFPTMSTISGWTIQSSGKQKPRSSSFPTMSTTPGGTNYGEFRYRIPGAHPPIPTMSPRSGWISRAQVVAQELISPKNVHYVRLHLPKLMYRIPEAQALRNIHQNNMLNMTMLLGFLRLLAWSRPFWFSGQTWCLCTPTHQNSGSDTFGRYYTK